jgi:hypothetical protein
MEAVLNSGKKIHGRLADILVKKGRAVPYGFVPETKAPKKPKAPKKTKAKK